MKKSLILFGALILSILAISLVAAQALPAPPIAMQDVSNFFSNLLVGSQTGTDVMGRLLIFLLLTVVLYRAAEKVAGGNTTLAVIISSLVSLVAIRFMTDSMIRGITLPYTTLGIVISIFFPFVIFGFFVETSSLNAVMRRLGWILMMVIFLSLWYFRWTNIGDMAWIYFIAAVVSLVVLLLDGTIRKLAVEMKVAKTESTILNIQIDDASQQVKKLYEQLKGATTPDARKALIEEIKKLESNIKTLTTDLSKK